MHVLTNLIHHSLLPSPPSLDFIQTQSITHRNDGGGACTMTPEAKDGPLLTKMLMERETHIGKAITTTSPFLSIKRNEYRLINCK